MPMFAYNVIKGHNSRNNFPPKFILDLSSVVISIVHKIHYIWMRQTKAREWKLFLGQMDVQMNEQG